MSYSYTYTRRGFSDAATEWLQQTAASAPTRKPGELVPPPLCMRCKETGRDSTVLPGFVFCPRCGDWVVAPPDVISKGAS